MVKLRVGPGTCHVLGSRGPSMHAMHFYSSRYSTEYGPSSENFQARRGRHTGTGYSSNFRPQLYYSRSQDNLDNPTIGFLLSNNYETVTKQHYRGNTHPAIQIPANVTGVSDSGFMRERPLTIPCISEARNVFHDTRRYGGQSFSGIPPHHKPALHKTFRADPTEEENHMRGPRYMRSETKVKFMGDATSSLNIHQKDVGALENSGFTDNQQIEPINFKEGRSYGSNDYGQGISPLTRSVTNISYSLWKDDDGRESLPQIQNKASKETGFIKEQPRRLYSLRRSCDAYSSLLDVPTALHERVKKSDPAEYLNMKHPNNKTSVTASTYQGLQCTERSTEKLMQRVHVGNHEFSGDSLNNYRYAPAKTLDQVRFLTDNNMRFYQKTAQGIDREGWVMGGLQQPREDGYRRDFKVHSFAKTLDTPAQIRRLDPYVIKSLRCKNGLLFDHSHKHKVSDGAKMLPVSC